MIVQYCVTYSGRKDGKISPPILTICTHRKMASWTVYMSRTVSQNDLPRTVIEAFQSLNESVSELSED